MSLVINNRPEIKKSKCDLLIFLVALFNERLIENRRIMIQKNIYLLKEYQQRIT